MGLFGFLGKQFVDVIEWNESVSGVLATRYPMQDSEIQTGASLTVRESQMALFVNEGKIADLFPAGRYTLTTANLPILTNLKNWDKAFASPFKSDIYFFSTREQIDQRWGTQQPLVVRDPQFGPIQLRAHGTYSYRLADPKLFFSKVSGTQEAYTATELEPQLRAGVITQLATFLGRSNLQFVEMAANQNQFSQLLKEALSEFFSDYGLSLTTFFVQSLSLPEELQAYLNKAAEMKMVGDLGKYTQFQAADSISAAAKNEGGAAGVGAGLGVGVAMGQAMTQALGSAIKGPEGKSPDSGNASAEDPMTTITKLHELMKSGIISAAEFEAKKTELLSRIK